VDLENVAGNRLITLLIVLVADNENHIKTRQDCGLEINVLWSEVDG
jgi:hypothetical protein